MCYIYTSNSAGRLAELADAHALGACGVTHKSSTLLSPTRNVALFVATNVALRKKCCTRMTTILGLIDKVVSTVLKSTEFTKLKFVAVNVALTTKCCKVERVCIEGFNSEPLARLRIYPPNSYVPTTAYFVAIPTTFF